MDEKEPLKQAMDLGQFSMGLRVVGGAWHKMKEAEAEGLLKEGCDLELIRESQNPHDSNAIKVLVPDGRQVGYIEKMGAFRLAPILDSGTKVGARVKHEIASKRASSFTLAVFEGVQA